MKLPLPVSGAKAAAERDRESGKQLGDLEQSAAQIGALEQQKAELLRSAEALQTEHTALQAAHDALAASAQKVRAALWRDESPWHSVMMWPPVPRLCCA